MPARVMVALAAVNAVAFSGSTLLPLWIGGIATEFDRAPWFAGLAALFQIGGAAAMNLATPLLFRTVAPIRLARAALIVAAIAYLVAAVHLPILFLAACLISGCALGTVLNVTNRLMGSAEHVQRGYATFILIEVAYATSLFLVCAALIVRYGLLAIFPAVSVVAVVAWVLLHAASTHAAPPSKRAGSVLAPAGNRWRAFLCLGAFALFFIGQAALNAFMPTIGQAAGLDAPHARQVIGLGMPFGFAGAGLARLVGERVRPVLAVVLIAGMLGCAAPFLTTAPNPAAFMAGVVMLALSTTFVVPYFFAQLGALDRDGRYAALGPAMMLCGIAIGPAISVMLQAQLGLVAVGMFACLLLLSGAAAFARSALGSGAARSARSPDVSN